MDKPLTKQYRNFKLGIWEVCICKVLFYCMFYTHKKSLQWSLSDQNYLLVIVVVRTIERLKISLGGVDHYWSYVTVCAAHSKVWKTLCSLDLRTFLKRASERKSAWSPRACLDNSTNLSRLIDPSGQLASNLAWWDSTWQIVVLDSCQILIDTIKYPYQYFAKSPYQHQYYQKLTRLGSPPNTWRGGTQPDILILSPDIWYFSFYIIVDCWYLICELFPRDNKEATV